jgi:hypothetical protein
LFVNTLAPTPPVDRSHTSYILVNMANQPGLWKKRVLVPFWIVRICIMVFVIAAYAWALRHVGDIADFTKPAIG